MVGGGGPVIKISKHICPKTVRGAHISENEVGSEVHYYDFFFFSFQKFITGILKIMNNIYFFIPNVYTFNSSNEIWFIMSKIKYSSLLQRLVILF